MRSTVAPGFTCRTLFTAETAGMSPHLVAEDFSSLATCVTGKEAPARVGRAVSHEKYFVFAASSTTGSTSPTGVPPQPPSANDRRPPSISRPPPRLLTKSAIMRSCSGENDAASTLPRMIAR